MIHVEPQPEPDDFDQLVRRPGQAYLSSLAGPPRQWKGRDYWGRTLSGLHRSYGGICAYCATWIPYTTGISTVDHYVPKSENSALAYEWGNFRLASLRMNSRKGTNRDVLDPFEIDDGWFILDVPSMMIRPGPGLSAQVRRQVEDTIVRLKLNRDEDTVTARLQWVKDYCSECFSFEYLRSKAPFIAQELQRQDLDSADRLRGLIFPAQYSDK